MELKCYASPSLGYSGTDQCSCLFIYLTLSAKTSHHFYQDYHIGLSRVPSLSLLLLFLPSELPLFSRELAKWGKLLHQHRGLWWMRGLK